jgi:hypothetical protein
MENILTLPIRNSVDMIAARARVREAARQKGLDLTDQARISLAVYSLATVLRMGGERPGRVVVDCLDDGKRVGMRVACIATEAARIDSSPSALGDVGSLVDELIVEALPPGVVKVTLVQWSAQRGSGVFDRERPFAII